MDGRTLGRRCRCGAQSKKNQAPGVSRGACLVHANVARAVIKRVRSAAAAASTRQQDADRRSGEGTRSGDHV